MRTTNQLFSGLRFRLLLLVVAASVPPVLLTLHIARQERQGQRAALRQRSHDMVQLASRKEDEMIAGTRQLLRALAESAQVQSGRAAHCDKLLAALFADYPRYANLGVIRTNGEILASALALAGPVQVADRSYFQRALSTRALSIGDYQVGQISGKPTVNFGYPVFNAAGQVQAVVFAALDLDWLNRSDYALQAFLPKGGTWTKIDANGTILARYPAPEKWLGQPLPEQRLLPAFLAQKNGFLEAADPKGVPVFHDFTSTHSALVAGGVISILSVPRKVLFAESNRLMLRNLTSVGIVAGLVLALGWIGSRCLILRPIRALVDVTARLGSGDHGARTGLPRGRDELSQLTAAVDRMAEALQQREAESQRAVTQLRQSEGRLKKSSQRLHDLSRRLVQVQEAERRHIARELHDEIGQALTATEMNLQALLESPGIDTLAPRLQQALLVVERVQEQVHDLSLNLRPSMLDDLGLEPALRWYTERQAALAGFQAEFQADPLEHRLDPAIETECFRVAQQALTNVVQHAKAHVVTVELSKDAEEQQLHLSVRDDGVGFEVEATRARAVRGDSLGLLSMEERATLAGGGIEYHSTPGRGTEVHAWFPLQWAHPPLLIGKV